MGIFVHCSKHLNNNIKHFIFLMKTPNYLFETSWEVCNMVGGIYTVLSTKADEVKQKIGDNYITLSP